MRSDKKYAVIYALNKQLTSSLYFEKKTCEIWLPIVCVCHLLLSTMHYRRTDTGSQRQVSPDASG